MKTNLCRAIRNGRWSFLAVGFLFTVLHGHNANAQVTPFIRANIPVGVATDAAGNVFLTSDATFTTLLSKISPNGQVLGSIQIGGTMVGNLGRLAFDRATSTVWDLLPGGDLLNINPTSGQVRSVLNLKRIVVDVNQVFDVASRTMGPFDGMLTQYSTYGDIALRRRGRTLDVFVSGVSIAFPFVMRLRFIEGQLSDARVLVASRGSGAGYSSSPRGVAVSPQGIVLTTLPMMFPGEFNITDRLFAFSGDFPETRTFLPVALSRTQLFSRGMTSDQRGNFYIATGAIGAAFCGVNGSGALVRISADLRQARCTNVNAVIAQSEDVAVNPTATRAYMTLRNMGLVAWADLRTP